MTNLVHPRGFAPSSTFSLKIVTLNVKGMADPSRRRFYFYLLRTFSAQVICLQEVHANTALASQWTREWGGTASWTPHTAILLDPSLGDATFDDRFDGRVLSSTFRHRGQIFSLANIYAPADRAPRAQFFDTLAQDASYFSSLDFLAGDWNAYPDLTQDCSTSSTFLPPQTWPRLQPCLTSFYDAALLGSPHPYFTFHHAGIAMHARIDHVFANCRHVDFEVDTSVAPCTKSDHDALVVTFSLPSTFSTPSSGATTPLSSRLTI